MSHSCTVVDYTAHSFTHRLGPPTPPLNLLMTGNKLPVLTSLVSNCIGWMDMYWHGHNLMNPWTQHVNRELFNLVEPLWCYGAFAFGLIWDL
ncbi:hypothetical protein AVEN_123962-1 [Araneus ventricosus]|uniref:Uncharacterized protein n=1 Tax=Araneus ventricosus TaxID=182803 RepID=A0A4Y2SAS7_ARAVE|nr:hypothetical protein AVEN_27307-1 [Araneus ventricosus]GBN85338.1 hypothetical protein AVEN_123962-1 [Araneus ventricosus]